MLTLSENARTIVKQLTSGPGAPETAGLRISSEADAEFAVAAAEQAAEGDQVVQEDGATIYLDNAAAERLDGMVLDAGVDETGNVQFGLMSQA